MVSGRFAHATAADPAASQSTGAEPPAIKRILANWRDRRERFKTLHFEWRSHYSHPQLRRFDARCEIWIDEQLHYQIATESAAEHATQQNAFDGVTSRELIVRSGSGVGKFKNGKDGLPLEESAVRTWLMAMSPAAQAVSNRPEPRLITENAILDGKHFVKLQSGGDGLVDTYWIDPAREQVVVNWERRQRNGNSRTTSIEYRHDEKYGWIPAAWNETTPYKAWDRTIRVTKYEINAKLPAGIFSPTFPPGTIVFDKNQTQKFVVAKDGTKRDLVKFDSVATMHIEEVLEDAADFTIAPEPLKDAIDFIQQRYRLNLIIDREMLRQLNTEVQAQSDGMKVRKLIESLLQKSQIPLRYEVRQGALVIEAGNRLK